MTTRLLLTAVVTAASSCVPERGRDDVTTLRFWGMGREGEVVAELMAGFHAENPDIRVHVQQIPWTAAHEKLLTAYVGGAMPDVAQLGNTWVPEFAAIRALAPLDPWIARSRDLSADEYFEGIWSTNLVADTVWGVPWYVDTRVIFYRTDLLARAGYDSIPQTWDGWVEALHALKRVMGPDRYPIFLPTNEWAQPAIFGLQNGSTLLADGGTRGAFSEPAFREAFEFYLSLYRDGLAPPMGQYDVANPYQEFSRGFFAMWITGPWNLGEFKRRLPADEQHTWSTAPMPGPTGPASGVSLAGGASLVMYRETRHPESAWKLIEYLSRPEQQQRFYELTGSLPARMDAWHASELATAPLTRAFWEQLQRVEPLPAVPEIESIVSRVIEFAELSIRGGTSAADALAGLDRDTDRILEKRRWMLARNGRGPGNAAPENDRPGIPPEIP